MCNWQHCFTCCFPCYSLWERNAYVCVFFFLLLSVCVNLSHVLLIGLRRHGHFSQILFAWYFTVPIILCFFISDFINIHIRVPASKVLIFWIVRFGKFEKAKLPGCGWIWLKRMLNTILEDFGKKKIILYIINPPRK